MTQTFRLTPLAFGALLLSASAGAQTTAPAAADQPASDQPASDQPMQTVVVSASADASAQGLPTDYAGGAKAAAKFGMGRLSSRLEELA